MATVLIDMDGCLANLWDSAGEQMRRNGFIPVKEADLTEWAIEKAYPGHVLQSEMRRALNTPGTFYAAQPRAGALDAIQQLSLLYEVFIVTTLWPGNPQCAQEKTAWVRLHLGDEWVKRLVFTYDKTIVHGDVLIDDKPEITGVSTPSWDHILFHQGYNAHVKKPRIAHWDQARAVVRDVIRHNPLFIGNPDPEQYRSSEKWVAKRKPDGPVARFD